MPLTPHLMAKVRSEIGTTEPPTDGTLHALYDDLQDWRKVAIAILKMRRADIVSGAGSAASSTAEGVKSVALSGVLSVGFGANSSASSTSLNAILGALDRQIAALEADIDLDSEDEEPSGLVSRRLSRTSDRGWPFV